VQFGAQCCEGECAWAWFFLLHLVDGAEEMTIMVAAEGVRAHPSISTHGVGTIS
jgi:hypothetical protein